MSDARLLPPALLVVVALVLAMVLLSRGDAPGAQAPGAGLDGARYELQGGSSALPAPSALNFAPGVAPSDRQVVTAAVAASRPEARKLVDLVAGLVTVSVGSPAQGVAGEMRTTPAGYDVQLDLGPVYAANGLRGVRRVVMHELAHVIDHAVVPAALERELDAATPPGFGCDDNGRSGACAAREERFAESFAKWATGDIGVDIHLGYRVPPPASLQTWGAPLAALAR